MCSVIVRFAFELFSMHSEKKASKLSKFGFKSEWILYTLGVHSRRVQNGYSRWIPHVLWIQTEFLQMLRMHTESNQNASRMSSQYKNRTQAECNLNRYRTPPELTYDNTRICTGFDFYFVCILYSFGLHSICIRSELGLHSVKEKT